MQANLSPKIHILIKRAHLLRRSLLNRGQDTLGVVTTPDAPAHANANGPTLLPNPVLQENRQVTMEVICNLMVRLRGQMRVW
jgi:hypothetical protein